MSDEDKLTKYERERFLIKLDKEFAFAGATIPSAVEVDGERIRLKAFVFETAAKRGAKGGGLSPEELAEADRIIRLLRKKRREIVSRISGEEMTGAEAKELYGMAIGLDRALDTLYDARLPKPSIKEESMKARREDGRRWLNLIKKVYSREDTRKGG
jgi:hypothetical protein